MSSECGEPSLSRYKDARYRCRCSGCVAANARYMVTYRRTRLLSHCPHLVDATGCQRALLASREHGVTYAEIANLVGLQLMEVYRLSTGATRHCSPATARAVLAACDE